jgi:hypothetical protein
MCADFGQDFDKRTPSLLRLLSAARNSVVGAVHRSRSSISARNSVATRDPSRPASIVEVLSPV